MTPPIEGVTISIDALVSTDQGSRCKSPPHRELKLASAGRPIAPVSPGGQRTTAATTTSGASEPGRGGLDFSEGIIHGT